MSVDLLSEHPERLVDAPYQVSLVPNESISDDHPSQEEVLSGVLRERGSTFRDSENAFYETEVSKLTIRQLERNYNSGRQEAAMKLLHRRNRIEFEREDKIESDDPQLVWGAHKHFLDFMLVVPREMGLDAIIPNRQVNHNYEFRLQLSDTARPWAGKHGELGFNPARRMMHVGYADSHEVWLAMVPLSFFGEDCPQVRYKHDDDSASANIMPYRRHRRCLYMLSYMLEAISFSTITTHERYSALIDTDQWKVHTNIRYVFYVSLFFSHIILMT